jgi:transcriptional regulator with XRE-family HTH domain
MKDNETKDRFVELRAQGKSFATIAEELNVSKPTLIEWSKDLQVEIANLRAVNVEALHERYRLTKERQLQALSHQLETVEAEIEKRGLTDVPTDKLFNILFKLSDELQEEDKPMMLRHSGLTMIDLEPNTTWEA